MFSKKIIMSLMAVVFITLTNIPSTRAQTVTSYDLTAQFSWEQNPNGVWSYGWSESKGSAFNLITTTGDLYGIIIGWTPPFWGIISPAYALSDWPGVPAGTVNLHPGPQGQNTIIRWTAPSSGTYTIEGWFKGNNFAPTTTDVAIMHGTTEIFSGVINSYHVPLSFSLIELVEVGDTIDFTVGDGGNGYYSDATGISATISLQSPPESTQMLIYIIKTWNLPKGTEKSLTSKLQNAIQSLENGQQNAAINKLNAFINEAQAQRDKKLTIEQADMLVSEAQKIISTIQG